MITIMTMIITPMNNETYLKQINLKETDSLFVSLRTFAKENNVPIITYEGMLFLKQLIALKHAKNILEIGTAIGYSALHMASTASHVQITTIERDESMIKLALKHIENSTYKDQITLIKGDALTVDLAVLNAPFDLIFIDAAKAQSINFFERFEPLLKEEGVIVTDNLLFHGLLFEENTSKNVKSLTKKIDAFNQYLMTRNEYFSVIYPIGDGMSVSLKQKR
ncbi:O-methyltransferase [Liberiplasma polymorphum]|jgi:predicted O-methyltransferase YrrM|uniref:O-methyltransferase n=1 Tax=Liberiplasma polymorphum TaxID=3374570 RepID=UPI003771800A